MQLYTCGELIQPLGLLAWAANGKDLGLTPLFILDMGMRTHYVQEEFDVAIVNHSDYDLIDLSRQWHEMAHLPRGRAQPFLTRSYKSLVLYISARL